MKMPAIIIGISAALLFTGCATPITAQAPAKATSAGELKQNPALQDWRTDDLADERAAYQKARDDLREQRRQWMNKQ